MPENFPFEKIPIIIIAIIYIRLLIKYKYLYP